MKKALKKRCSLRQCDKIWLSHWKPAVSFFLYHTYFNKEYLRLKAGTFFHTILEEAVRAEVCRAPALL